MIVAIATMTAANSRSTVHITRTFSYRSAITPAYALNRSAGMNRNAVAAASQATDPVAS